MKPVLNINEAEYIHSSKGDVFEERYAPIAEKIGGGSKLGYSVSIVPPGKRVCPYHNHLINEEMFFIIEGEGTYRFNNQEYKVKAGDVVAAPPGGPETAHHIINTSKVELKYLCVSSMEEPDICEYPDSGKFLVSSNVHNNVKDKFRYIGRLKNSIDYFDGEKIT